jgi:hypothetical protein
VADVVEVHALQKRVDDFLPFALLRDALQRCEVAEHRLRRDLRIDPELLR